MLGAALVLGCLAVAFISVVVISTRRKLKAVARIPTFEEDHFIWGHMPWFTSPNVHRQLTKQAELLG